MNFTKYLTILAIYINNVFASEIDNKSQISTTTEAQENVIFKAPDAKFSIFSIHHEA